MSIDKFRLGIDPGVNGFVAAVSDSKIIMEKLRFFGDSSDFDFLSFDRFIEKIGKDKISSVTLERLGYFGPGKISGVCLAEMMRCYGAVESCVLRHFDNVRRVSPSVWKRKMKLTKDKDLSKIRAKEEIEKRALSFFGPKDGARFYRCGELTHDACEAILLAVFE